DPVGLEGRDDGLEEGRAAQPAVAATAGGQAEGLARVVERAATVTGLGTHRGLDEAPNGPAALVMERDIERGDPASVHAGRAAVAAHRLADERVGRGRDVDVA